MAKTAKLVREDLQKHKSKFMGSFSAGEIQSSIPLSLLRLVNMIEHGPDTGFPHIGENSKNPGILFLLLPVG
jgi:hypothetical protein